MITQEYLKSILDYNPITGIFIWKVNRGGKLIGEIAGTFNKDKYILIGIKGVQYYAHRLAWLYMTGEWPEFEIDHIDIKPFNNKWNNLRKSTCGQNQQNRKKRKDNTTGVTGVVEFRGMFWARINLNKKNYNLGYFNSLEEAKAARDKAILDLHPYNTEYSNK